MKENSCHHEKPAVANLGSRLHQDKLVKTKHLRLILENLLLGKARKAKPRFSESTGAPRGMLGYDRQKP